MKSETVLKTTKCRFEFSCLKGVDECLCPVENPVGDFGLFVKPEKHCNCSYKISFGEGFICFCPVRYELFIQSEDRNKSAEILANPAQPL